MIFPRSAGVLLHISSLPGPFAIGDLGKSSREFAEFLNRSGQKIWQILPLCPPAAGHSPYSSYSAFAANVDLISPNDMIEDGFGSQADLTQTLTQFPAPDPGSTKVDYELARSIRDQFFRKSFQSQRSCLNSLPGYLDFCEINSYWLDDLVTFESIARIYKTLDWTTWPEELARKESAAIDSFVNGHLDEIEYSRFLQFLFRVQWQRFKRYCNERDIRVYGDLPIFVDHQSADVWSHQQQFELDADGRPEFVAGVPPDYFSETGQKWGNPLYRWDVMESDGFNWWIDRFRRALDQFDIIRVDHFRGFQAYWRIPASAKTAREGEWEPGPGVKPFQAAAEQLGELPIVAEDLGLITEDVNQLRQALNFPTMRVLQFGYGTAEDDFHRPAKFPTHCFAYTGTHDNETIVGWFQRQMETGTAATQKLLQTEFDLSDEAGTPIHWQMIQDVLNSVADTAVIPMQDYLGLGNESRMNLPATIDGNWQWKLDDQQEWLKLEQQIRTATENSGR